MIIGNWRSLSAAWVNIDSLKMCEVGSIIFIDEALLWVEVTDDEVLMIIGDCQIRDYITTVGNDFFKNKIFPVESIDIDCSSSTAKK